MIKNLLNKVKTYFSCKVKTYFFVVSVILGSLSMTFSYFGSKVSSEGAWWDPYRADHLVLGIGLLFSVIGFMMNAMKFTWFKENKQLTWFSAANIIRSMLFTIFFHAYHLIFHLDAYLFPVIVVGIAFGVLYMQSNLLGRKEQETAPAA